MTAQRLALIDCNNFYVSCEQAFNPTLRGRPVVVLSNNDGCVVSRSAEAKQAKIAMGVPYFQIRKQLADINGVALSSNYVLYADMSSRAMRLIREQIPKQEIYSIDECFVDLSDFPADRALVEAFRLRQRLLQCLSLPVSIGIGSSKTLAKLASAIAKRRPASSGVCDLSGPLDHERQSEMLTQPVSEVWGIGHRTTQSLETAGIHSVGDLIGKPESWLRKRYSINLLKTVSELKGQSCLGFQTAREPRQQIIASRSFGQAVYEKPDLIEALSTFATRAGERLREDHSLASVLQIYYRAQDPANAGAACADSIVLSLLPATDDTREIIRQALHGLDLIYRPGLKYKKAGVVLAGITSADIQQPALPGIYPLTTGSSQTMRLMDQVNQRYGRDTLRVAATGTGKKSAWHMSCSSRSRRYTTTLTELPLLSAYGMR